MYILCIGDAITAIDYDETGDYLATGSRSGKVSILKVENSFKCRVNFEVLNTIVYYLVVNFRYLFSPPQKTALVSLCTNFKVICQSLTI